MKKLKMRRQRGDTLVEVSIAIAILGLVLVATIMVINRSLLGIMNSVERTSVRGEINRQVELVKFVFDRKLDTNKNTAKALVDEVIKKTNPDIGNKDYDCIVGKNAFYLKENPDFKKGDKKEPISIVTAANDTNLNPTCDSGGVDCSKPENAGKNIKTAADNLYGAPKLGQGIWVQGVIGQMPTGNMPGFIDFYVRACWSPYGSKSIGMGRTKTVTRVYYSEDK